MNKKWMMVIMLVSMFTTVATSAQGKQDRQGQHPAKMFASLDTDADGKLSQAEVDKAQKGKLKENFTAIDTNKDSFLDKAELKAYREKRRAEKKVK